MKTLILMRHAKSAWDDPNQADFDRPVSPRGREAAPRMAAWLGQAGPPPELVLCSAAERARQTLDLIKSLLPKRAKIQYQRELYMATPREILNVLAKAKPSDACVLVIGHNPGIGNLASWLVGAGGGRGSDVKRPDAKAPASKDPQDKSLAKLRAKFPTAAVAILQFDLPRWADVTGETGTLLAFMRPRDLA